MKRLGPIFLVIGMWFTHGCMSVHVVKNKAQSHWEYDPEERHYKLVEGRPSYYALLPLTIPADVATYPCQLMLAGASSSSMLFIDGWPVPLP